VSPKKSEQEQWLAEAATALAEAERLAGLLALAGSRSDVALAALQAEIMGLRREVERMRRERTGDTKREFHPKWLEYSAWHSAR
jgi:hypothetical protein